MKLFSKSILFVVFALSAIIFNACLDDCELIDCQNGGTCDLGFCECPTGFTGEFCEVVGTEACADVSCENGGTCVDGTCDCLDGFSGPNCENVVDPCDNVTCENGGTCDDGTCDCATGYEGTNCETEERAKFYGTYEMNEDCDGTPFSYDLIITEGTGDVTSITLTNFAESYTIEANVSGNDFTITNEENGGNTFNGMGNINGDDISYNFTATGDYDLNCTATGSK